MRLKPKMRARKREDSTSMREICGLTESRDHIWTRLEAIAHKHNTFVPSTHFHQFYLPPPGIHKQLRMDIICYWSSTFTLSLPLEPQTESERERGGNEKNFETKMLARLR